MSTETATNPDTGVAGQGDNAPSDDIDTEAFDRVAAPEDDDPDAKPADAEGADKEADDPDKPKPAEDDDHVEVEHEGQKVRVPKALKDSFLRHADYTQKTTKLAEERRALDTERTTWESQREESRAALPEEHAAVAILQRDLAAVEKTLADFENVDWETWRRETSNLAADDPNRMKYERYRRAYMDARDTRIDLADRTEAARKDLSTKEADRLAKQQEARTADLAKRRQETGQALAAEVEGWSPKRAAEVATFMHSDLGLDPEEIGELTDVKTWKFVDQHMKLLDEVATLRKALKQQETAKGHEKAQQTEPAKGGKGGGGQPRDPATPRGDGLSTEEWARRRRLQKAKSR